MQRLLREIKGLVLSLFVGGVFIFSFGVVHFLLSGLVSSNSLVCVSSFVCAMLCVVCLFFYKKGECFRFYALELAVFIMILLGCALMFSVFSPLVSEDKLSNLNIIAYLLVSSLGLYMLYFAFAHINSKQVLGTSVFANGLAQLRMGLFKRNGFVLGKNRYGYLKYNGYEPMIVVSGTGGGKTSSLVIPNMFELNSESIVVTDIKGEIYEKTAQYRESIGSKVLRIQPGDEAADSYNPLSMVRDGCVDEDLDIIFKTLIPDSSDPLWAEGSRNVAKMMAMFYLLEKKEIPTLQGIYKEICSPCFSDEVEVLYDSIKTDRVGNLFGKFLSAREKTRSDLLLNAQEYLSKFDSPNLARATSESSFKFSDLREGLATIYLILPANIQTYGSLCSLFFEQMLAHMTEKEPTSSDFSVTAMIDEFANLPKMNSVAKGISYLRSYRVRVCAFIQQMSQLREVYGENMKDGFMSCPVKLAFNITSKQDAEYFSQLAGTKTIKVKNASTNDSWRSSISSQKQSRKLLSPDEVMRLPSTDLLAFISGQYVVRAKKNFWFRGNRYKF